MVKIDQKFTQQLQDWLNLPASKRNIEEGAKMLLQLTRNRALYNAVITRPAKLAAKLEYELRKYLRMRLHNMSVADVVRLESEVIPRAQESVSRPPVAPDEEHPADSQCRGRRADHASLPVEVQALYDRNIETYQTMEHLFNELQAMEHLQPCDRFEVLVQLDKVESRYRRTLELYDNWHEGDPLPAADKPVKPAADPSEAEAPAKAEVPASPDVVKHVQAARKSISKYRKQLAELDESDPKRDKIIAKLQAAVDVVVSSGAGISDATASELRQAGISL